MKFKVFDKEDKKFLKANDILMDQKGVLHGSLGKFSKYQQERYTAVFSTGLKDKNGKEYEDGSVFNAHGWTYVICWSDKTAGFCCKHSEDNFKNELPLPKNGLPHIKIIGSSLTNPELLEQ